MIGWLQACIGVHGDGILELQPFVVEGRHFDEVAIALPMSAKRLEREAMERSGARSVPELLEQMAGVRFLDTTGTGTSGQVAMRGFGDNSGLRVLVIVDGQVYNPPDMGGISWEGIDLDELETVEVLRGGQTVLYGNHAVSGVIKLTTREIEEGIAGRLAFGLGSDGQSSVRLGAGARKGTAGIRAAGSWRESEGYRQRASMTSRTGQLAFRWADPERSSWASNLHYSRSELELPGPLTFLQMLEDPRQARQGIEDIVGTEELQFAQHGEGTTSWGEWQLTAGLLDRDRQWDLSGSSADNLLRRLTLNPRTKLDLHNGFLIAGFDFSWDRLDYRGYWDAARSVILSWADIERKTTGGYLFGSLDLDEQLNLSIGIRSETADTDNEHVHYKENQLFPELETNRGTFPNPDYKDPPDADPVLSFRGPVDKSGWAGEVSIVWEVTDAFSVWAGWDRVYRYPSVDEVASYQGYPLSDPLNEDLLPETGNNYELGIKRMGQNWHLGMTAFLLSLNDEISFIETINGSGDGVLRRNDNVGDSTRKGLELDVLYQYDRYGVGVFASYTEAELETATGRVEVPLVPKFESSMNLWIKPNQSTRIQLQGRYLSSQAQGNDFAGTMRRVPSCFLASVFLYWDICDGCSLSFGVRNIFDRIHAVSAYSGGFYPGAGRQVHTTARFDF